MGCKENPLYRHRWFILGVTLAVTLIALAVTRDLPVPQQYEARYELRLRDYHKNIDNPDAVMESLMLLDSYGLSRYLDSLPAPDGVEVSVQCDKTKKITIRVRHSDAVTAAEVAAQRLAVLTDTATRFGDSMCVKRAAVYRDWIDSLRAQPPTAENSALLKDFVDRLAILEADKASGMAYVEVLNRLDGGVAHRTASRPWVVVISLLAAFLFSCVMALLRRATPFSSAHADER